MKIEPIEHSSLYCIFADELRREADGRDTILGWYPDGANIAMPPEGPALLQRLMVGAIMTIPMTTEPSEVVLDLVLNETVIHTSTISKQHFEELRSNNANAASPLRAGVFRIFVQSQNLPIAEHGTLRARITMGDLVLHGNGLQFIRAEPE